jgi:hypothetical protein
MAALQAWRPTFIGIGAAKSATTWCWDVLRKHPQVDAGQPKEINFFNFNFDRGVDWYARHFAHPERCARGEISPLYMEDPIVAQRIAATFPDSTLLVVLRNPFARALSNVLHDVRDSRGAVANVPEQLVRKVAAGDAKFLRRSLYAKCLEPFFERFRPNQFEVLFYEDLQRDARQFLRRLYSAVRVDADFLPDGWQTAVNRTQDYASARIFKMLQRASQTAKSFAPTRAGLHWVYRKTRLREWMLATLSVDRGQPSFEFERIFGPQACQLIRDDMNRLRRHLRVELPDSWHVHVDAPARGAA